MSRNGYERKTIRTDIKKVEDTDDTTKLLVKVTSFGSPEVKDLGGDYFKRDCDFGDSRVKTVKAFYDHALNTENNPYSKAEMQLLGAATLTEVDDAGRWFQFEIEKSNAYHDSILALHEMKVLGASTQAYMGGVDREDDGGISRWWESEVTLTVMPMDQKTIGETFLVLEQKSLKDDDRLKALIEDWKKVLEQESSDADANADANADVDDTESQQQDIDDLADEIPDVDFDEDIQKILDNVEEDVEEANEKFVTQDQFKTLMEELQKVSGSVTAYIDLWGSLDEGDNIASILGRLTAQQAETNKAVFATQKAVKHLATHTAKVVSSEVAKSINNRSSMSQIELEAENLLDDSMTNIPNRKLVGNANTVFPDHAPGGN